MIKVHRSTTKPTSCLPVASIWNCLVKSAKFALPVCIRESAKSVAESSTSLWRIVWHCRIKRDFRRQLSWHSTRLAATFGRASNKNPLAKHLKNDAFCLPAGLGSRISSKLTPELIWFKEGLWSVFFIEKLFDGFKSWRVACFQVCGEAFFLEKALARPNLCWVCSELRIHFGSPLETL